MSENKEKTLLVNNEKETVESLKNEHAFADLRNEAYHLWKETPAPTTRDEYWKYTRLAPLLKKTYNAQNQVDSTSVDVSLKAQSSTLVFVNGQINEALSSSHHEADFIFCDLNTAKVKYPQLLTEKLTNSADHSDYFSLLNSAFHENGPFIYLGKNKQIDAPLNILYLSSEKDRLINVKGMIIAKEGSQCVLTESWEENGGSENLINARNDFYLSDNASVELIKLQAIGSKNSLINQEFVSQSRDSRFTAHTISLNGNLVRNNIKSSLNGEGAVCTLNGLYTLKGNEHVDNHTTVTHAVPNCESHELYKGILNEKSKGVFNGKVIVSRDAQKTNAFQFNGNILLTDDAEIYSKPELEIYADDVKCSHGSTTGQLDQEAMFYLQARGISKKNARNLLLQAFASEVTDKISNEAFRSMIEAHLLERYHTLGNV